MEGENPHPAVLSVKAANSVEIEKENSQLCLPEISVLVGVSS